jgi:hypothetical protein
MGWTPAGDRPMVRRNFRLPRVPARVGGLSHRAEPVGSGVTSELPGASLNELVSPVNGRGLTRGEAASPRRRGRHFNPQWFRYCSGP